MVVYQSSLSTSLLQQPLTTESYLAFALEGPFLLPLFLFLVSLSILYSFVLVHAPFLYSLRLLQVFTKLIF